MIEFRWGTATDAGRVRQNNQDQLLTSEPVFVVADGMGGHAGGEVASAIAVDEMAKHDQISSREDLIAAVQTANREIVDRSRLEPELRGMGTTLVTLVGMVVDGEPRLGVANVGDSRLYRSAAEELVQITEDHTLVEALVRDGRLTAEEAINHPQRNIVTRALGIDEKVLVDTWEMRPVAGDRYVLCSDGLFNELSSDEILSVLHEVDDPDEAAAKLTESACDAGGRDNVTVVIVDVVDTDAEPQPGDTDDRIIGIGKAVPDSVLRVTQQAETTPTDPHPDEIEVDRTVTKAPFVTWRLGLFVAAVLLVLGILASTLVAYARSSYFVGLDDDQVVIYKGQPDGVLWFDPTVEEPVVVSVADLDVEDLQAVLDNVEFDTLDDARDYAAALAQRSGVNPPP